MLPPTDHPFSVPRYPSSTPGEQARAHLLVTQDAVQAPHTPLAAHLALTDFANPTALQQALVEHLARAHVGLHITLQGDEAFVWPLHALARSAGLQEDEIHLDCPPNGTRQVFCVHCATSQDAGPTARHRCRHCGVQLEVRRHFSQRLGAYLGVCVDADQPYAEVRS